MGASWGIVGVVGAVALGAAAVALAQWLRAARTRRALEASGHIVEVGNDPVLVADIVDGRVMLANAALCELLGYRREELLSRRLPDLHPKALVETSAARIAEIWERKGMVYDDLPFCRKDGEQVAVEVNRELVPRARRGERVLAEGDELELVTLVGGG